MNLLNKLTLKNLKLNKKIVLFSYVNLNILPAFWNTTNVTNNY